MNYNNDYNHLHPFSRHFYSKQLFSPTTTPLKPHSTQQMNVWQRLQPPPPLFWPFSQWTALFTNHYPFTYHTTNGCTTTTTITVFHHLHPLSGHFRSKQLFSPTTTPLNLKLHYTTSGCTTTTITGTFTNHYPFEVVYHAHFMRPNLYFTYSLA